jgi:hypothetical protein
MEVHRLLMIYDCKFWGICNTWIVCQGSFDISRISLCISDIPDFLDVTPLKKNNFAGACVVETSAWDATVVDSYFECWSYPREIFRRKSKLYDFQKPINRLSFLCWTRFWCLIFHLRKIWGEVAETLLNFSQNWRFDGSPCLHGVTSPNYISDLIREFCYLCEKINLLKKWW